MKLMLNYEENVVCKIFRFNLNCSLLPFELQHTLFWVFYLIKTFIFTFCAMHFLSQLVKHISLLLSYTLLMIKLKNEKNNIWTFRFNVWDAYFMNRMGNFVILSLNSFTFIEYMYLDLINCLDYKLGFKSCRIEKVPFKWKKLMSHVH